MLAALVLAVLTLVGGAPTAGAALPVGALNSLSLTVAHTPKPRRPPRKPTAPPTPAASTTTCGAPARPRAPSAPAPAAVVSATSRPAPSDPTRGPPRPAAHPSPSRPVTGRRSGPADPRAGIGRAHLTGHAPPPSYDGLPACSPGPIVERGPVEPVTAASFGTPSGRRGALPGVRGPPGTAAGLPTGHRSCCSAEPASRPR
ncbi:hypothetical protein ACN24L_34855 [Streptomyces microflavus]